MQGNIETRVGIFVLIALCVFVYMGFKIGSFRIDRGSYNRYTLFFKDISGLSRKAEVKIAGVKVGWVDEVALLAQNDQGTVARASVMVKKEFDLYENATALVRQDGLLGPKFIEIIPGSPYTQKLDPNSILKIPAIEQASVDEIMRQFKHIATNIEQVTDALRNSLAGVQGETNLKQVMSNIDTTFKHLSSATDTIATAVKRNENQLDNIFAIGSRFTELTDTLQKNIFPSFQQSIEKISEVFDRDFDRIATHLSTTASSIEGVTTEAKDGVGKMTSIVQKIDNGKGLLGKLINEDEMYNDLRSAVTGVKSYVNRMERIEIVFDTHFESMHRSAENYQFEDSKGYVDVRVHPQEDHFYLIQLASSQKGFIDRKEKIKRFIDNELQTINPDTLDLTDGDRVRSVLRKEKTTLNRNSLKIGLQFGKIFGDISIRGGLFEGTAGVGLDVELPFSTEKFRWITSFEMFDMRGWNRIDDQRPHLKWFNKMYFMRNLYVTFGADDFISKHNATGFVGGGISFADDDIKYLLGSFSSVVGFN